MPQTICLNRRKCTLNKGARNITLRGDAYPQVLQEQTSICLEWV